MNQLDQVPTDVTVDFASDSSTSAKTGSVPHPLKDREPSSLSPRERKLLLFRMDYHFSCHLAAQHAALDSDESALSAEELQALSLDSIPRQAFSRHERGLLQFCDEINERAEISDDTWGQCNRLLAPAQVIDLVHLVSDYALLAFSEVSRRQQLTRSKQPWQKYC